MARTASRQRFAAANYKPLIRCNGKLGPGATFNLGDILYEIHQVGGCARASVRLLCSSGGGNLDLFFVGPDVDCDVVIAKAPAYAAISGTLYATGNPTTVAVVAATEAQILAECYGEGYIIVKFTANVGGAIQYCDVSRL